MVLENAVIDGDVRGLVVNGIEVLPPRPDAYSVREVLGLLLSEEWRHRLYAERDLDVLEARPHG